MLKGYRPYLPDQDLLLPEYQREHSEETSEWDVVYDDRGHLLEPHTKFRIGIGTLAVRKYLRDAQQNREMPALG